MAVSSILSSPLWPDWAAISCKKVARQNRSTIHMFVLTAFDDMAHGEWAAYFNERNINFLERPV